jgi:O-antigen/teichoic acid export membrane protein
MSLASRTFRNTAMVTGSRLVSRVMVFYVFILIVRSLSHDDYGRYTLVLAIIPLVSVIVDVGLRPLFIREASRDRSVMGPYLNSILSLKVVMAIPAFIVTAIALHFVVPDAVGNGLLAAMAVMLGASFANQLRAVYYAVGELRYEAFTTIGETMVLLVGVVIAANLHLNYTWYLWAYAASWWFTVVFSSVIAVTRFKHRFRFDLQVARLSMLARESLPFALTFIISSLYYKIDQPMMPPLGVSLFAISLYGAAYKFLDAATFVPQALMDPVYPALSRIAGEAPERLAGATTKAYKMLAVASVPMAVTMLVLAEPIVRYGAGANYIGPGHNAVPVLRVLAIGVIFLFVNNTFIYTLNAMGRQSESTRLAVLSLVVNVALNVILIPQHNALYGGIMGAAWATGLTELALFAGGYLLMRKYLYALPVFGTLKGVIPSGILCGAVMAAVVALLPPHAWVYALALVAGGLAYAAALFGTHAFSVDEIALVREGLTSRTKR